MNVPTGPSRLAVPEPRAVPLATSIVLFAVVAALILFIVL